MTIEPKLMSAEELERYTTSANGEQPWSPERVLLAHIAAQEQRIAELEAELAKEAAATHQLAEEHEKQGMDLAFHRHGHNNALAEISNLELRLHIATETNVADRKRIAELEAERDVLNRDIEVTRSLSDPKVAEHFNRERYKLIAEVAKLKTDLGEAKLAIEQQDGTMERLASEVAGLVAERLNLSSDLHRAHRLLREHGIDPNAGLP